ncbi:uncharacterized protein LOC121719570 [Alosa sapidissima]|uniref:uncharacterized protein LOC121719570 n=1 Tax=Alosa sapidissima TaxID=34773 RepID=UPI001C09139C|nr:uncharacterized protein LOC121719570 [Alosa sapidissima]
MTLFNYQKKLAICKCEAHTNKTDTVSRGNALADECAKEATGVFLLQTETDEVLQTRQQQASVKERDLWKKHGCYLKDNIYVGPSGKPVLPKSMYKWAALVTHGRCHVPSGGMCTVLREFYTTFGFTTYSKNFCHQCIICIKHNSQGHARPKRGQFPSPPHPFHTIHIDFIQLNKVHNLEYVLVVIDVFSKWVELFPCRTPDAAAVAKALCRRIIPSHGVPRLIRSDNGTHFVNEDPKVKPGDWVFIKVEDWVFNKAEILGGTSLAGATPGCYSHSYCSEGARPNLLDTHLAL